MQPEATPVQTLIRDLHPKQFGVYDVELVRDAEMEYFSQISRTMDYHVWAVEVHSARLTLDVVTASALSSDLDDIPVEVVARVNQGDTLRATLMLGPGAVKALKPVLP